MTGATGATETEGDKPVQSPGHSPEHSNDAGETVTVAIIAVKAAKISLSIGLLVTAVLFIFTDVTIAAGHAAGITVGMINLLLLYRTSISIVGLEPEMAKSLLMRRYASRFILTLAFLVFLLLKTPVNPFAVMAGYTVILFGAIGTMAKMMGKEIAPVI